MSNAACKAAICDDEAEGIMMTACAKIQSLKGAPIELRIEHAEIYLKYMAKAKQVANKLIMGSGL